jgi:hypothetical protein
MVASENSVVYGECTNFYTKNLRLLTIAAINKDLQMLKNVKQ